MFIAFVENYDILVEKCILTQKIQKFSGLAAGDSKHYFKYFV